MLPVWLTEWWIKLYFFMVRPMLKWFLRRVTGKCELVRITYQETDRANRIKKTESSLNLSSNPEIKKCGTNIDFNVGDSAEKIIQLKNVVPEIYAQFEVKLKDSLACIKAYNRLLYDAENLRKIKYCSENEEHENHLRRVWDLYNPGVSLPQRVGPHWQDMGFQGLDPQTDFRGMGLLGLHQMIFFASTYPNEAKQVFLHSHHPQYGFSFAIVAINITGMGFYLLNKRKLRSHFYRLQKQDFNLEDFHHIFCYLMYEFTQFWLSEKPKDIMEFSRVRDKFLNNIKKKLKGPDSVLVSAFQEENS